MQFTDRLETLSKKFDEIEAALANPSGAFDQARFTALVKERAAIEETVATFRAYKALLPRSRRTTNCSPTAAILTWPSWPKRKPKLLRARRKELEEQLAGTDAAARPQR